MKLRLFSLIAKWRHEFANFLLYVYFSVQPKGRTMHRFFDVSHLAQSSAIAALYSFWIFTAGRVWFGCLKLKLAHIPHPCLSVLSMERRARCTGFCSILFKSYQTSCTWECVRKIVAYLQSGTYICINCTWNRICVLWKFCRSRPSELLLEPAQEVSLRVRYIPNMTLV